MEKRLGIALTLLLLVTAALFAGVNQTEIVLEIPQLMASKPPAPIHLPLYRLIIILLTAGFAVGILVGWGSGLKYRRLLKKLQWQNRQMEEEVRNLRNLPLEQDVHL
ncbi:MAG: LapA family protein [Magnetococcales bacterium]|nr:LapA family protein [Magnetococcales bacterium]